MTAVLARNRGKDNIAFKRGIVASRSFALKRSGRRGYRMGKGSLNVIVFVMVGAIILAGAFYLYQVNNIAVKGYEVRKIENQILDLEKENKKLKIQEVESKSMYNIEKATENLDLVNSANVSFVEMKGPMAMR